MSVTPSVPVLPGGTAEEGGLLGWWRTAPPDARRALTAAGLGWLLDAFDVMLYALVLAALMRDLDMTREVAGLLGSITLVASAAGGVLFGVVADRYGRTRALMASILLYSVFTAACGFAQSALQLAVFRVFLGLGMGGEWASGAALVAETWPDRHRAKALGLMQSAWAVGYALAAIVTSVVMPAYGWRAVFFVGVLPALFTLWIRRAVPEPRVWVASRASERRTSGGSLARVFREGRARLTFLLTAMNACCMFAWWGFNLWIPAYLSLPIDAGGVGLTTRHMAWLVVAMQVGMWFGYVSFGFFADAFGCKRVYVTYLLAAAVLMLAYGASHDSRVLLALGPIVAFFGTGYFTGFGAITAELYPTAIRATAQGFTYNTGRLASAAAPFVVGSLAERQGFGAAFAVAALAFLVAAVLWTWIPETRGRTMAQPG
jgi:MFS family permease